MEPIVEASGLVILTRSAPQKFLMLQHANRWDFPKGHLDAGENRITAALRETYEETGIPSHCIEIDQGFEFSLEYRVRNSKRGDYRKRVTYFLGYVNEPMTVHLTEHIGYCWHEWPVINPIQANTIDPVIDQLRKYLQS